VKRVWSRREFVLATAAGTAAVTVKRSLAPAAVVVFQGDSVTASARDRTIAAPNDPAALGAGYPLLIAASILQGAARLAWQFFNRAVGGDKVPDLVSRWDADTLALNPNVVSVLIGVNDYWHRQRGYTGTVADYETQYGTLLGATRRARPSVALVVLEPFVLRCGEVDGSWFPEFDERRAAAARVAERVGAAFVPLQAAFDAAAARTGPEHWAPDGVHPSPAGHALIAERWRVVVGA